jgi:tetratricopeptide (TPR) repeat protein
MKNLWLAAMAALLTAACDRSEPVACAVDSPARTARAAQAVRADQNQPPPHAPNSAPAEPATVKLPEREEPINAVSSALAFAQALDLDAPAEQGNVEYMTLDDAQRLLRERTAFSMDFLEQVAEHCRSFDVTTFLFTNLIQRVLDGEVEVDFGDDRAQMADLLKHFPNTEPYVRYFEDLLSGNTRTVQSAASRLLIKLAEAAMSQQEYEYALDLADVLDQIADRDGLRCAAYTIRGHAYYNLNDYQNEANAADHVLQYKYAEFLEYGSAIPALLQPYVEDYVSAIAKIRDFDTAAATLYELERNGYNIDPHRWILGNCKSRSRR